LAVVVHVVAVLAVLNAVWWIRAGRDGWAFATSAVAIGAAVASLFANRYPNVMVSSAAAANSLTVGNAASGDYTLKVMTAVAVVLFPVVLAYQIWTYVVFRRRVSGPPPEFTQSTTSAAAP